VSPVHSILSPWSKHEEVQSPIRPTVKSEATTHIVRYSSKFRNGLFLKIFLHEPPSSVIAMNYNIVGLTSQTVHERWKKSL